MRMLPLTYAKLGYLKIRLLPSATLATVRHLRFLKIQILRANVHHVPNLIRIGRTFALRLHPRLTYSKMATTQ